MDEMLSKEEKAGSGDKSCYAICVKWTRSQGEEKKLRKGGRKI